MVNRSRRADHTLAVTATAGGARYPIRKELVAGAVGVQSVVQQGRLIAGQDPVVAENPIAVDRRGEGMPKQQCTSPRLPAEPWAETGRVLSSFSL